MRYALIAILCCLMLSGALAKDVSNPSGLPIPRFVSLKSGDVNVRTGPGTRYPIQWVFKREGWPVEIIEEFDQWRKIRDVEGTTGWVHKAMLDSHRTALVQGDEPRVLRGEASDNASAMLKVAPGVLAKLAECQKDWCRVQVQSHKGWLHKKFLWGVYAKDEFK